MEDRLDRYAARMPFPLYALWAWAKRQYDDMPGPWWLKLPVVIVLLITPGPDEILILALPGLGRKIRAWRQHWLKVRGA